MKRKEMIELMTQEYRKLAIIRLSTSQIMASVLTAMEEKGMSPPPNPEASNIQGLGQLCGWEYDGENHE